MVTRKDLTDLLRWHQEIGVDAIVMNEPNNRMKPAEPPVVAVATKPVISSMPAQHGSTHPASACQTLDELKDAMANFNQCALKATAMNMVFSDGNPKASIMLVGEAPGADEDKQGLPFVGLSGQLLDRMLATVKLSRRDNIYITNIIPWRPPGNRPPTTAEIAACQPFVERHIELINPKILILIGGVAAKTLLNTTEGIVRLRGTWRSYQSAGLSQPIKTMATLHPAYLMRSPGQKAMVWRDLLAIAKEKKDIEVAKS